MESVRETEKEQSQVLELMSKVGCYGTKLERES